MNRLFAALLFVAAACGQSAPASTARARPATREFDNSPTSLQLSSSNPTSVFGQQVTFTATISGDDGTGDVPTGSVTFFDDLGPDPFGPIDVHTGPGFSDLDTESTGPFAGNSFVTAPDSTTVIGDDFSIVSTGRLAGLNVALKNCTALTGPVTLSFYPGHVLNGSRAAQPLATAVVDASAFACTAPPQPPFSPFAPVFPETPFIFPAPVPVVAGAPVTFELSYASSGLSTNTVFFFGSNTTSGYTTADGGSPVRTSSVGFATSYAGPQIATVTTSGLVAGSHQISALYDGDNNFASSGGNFQQQVNQEGTTATLSADLTSAGVGQTINFSVQVSAQAGTPTGEVDLFDGDEEIDGDVVNENGFISFAISNLSAGPHKITAQYDGDDDFSSVFSNEVDVTIVDPSTVTLSSDENPSFYGDKVTLTANVSTGGSTACTGNVNFVANGSDIIGSNGLDQNGNSSVSLPQLSAGFYSLTAVYQGDGNCAGGTSDAVGQEIDTVPTSTLVSFDDGATFGLPFNIIAQVTTKDGPIPEGTVTFIDLGDSLDGGTTLATVQLDGGQAVYNTSAALDEMQGGNHNIVANYTPSDDLDLSLRPRASRPAGFSPATVPGDFRASSDQESFTVLQNPFAGASIINVTPVVQGLPGSVTGFLTSCGPAQFCDFVTAPTGIVDFLDGGQIFASGNVAPGGNVTGSTAALSPGVHLVSIHYRGDLNFGPVDSGEALVSVLEPTLTTFSAAPYSAVIGQQVNLQAVVSPVLDDDFSPSGQVRFLDGGAPIGRASVGKGAAQLSVSTLTLGSHALSAAFLANDTWAASSSPVINFIVGPASTSTSLSVGPGGFTAAVAVLAPGAGNPTGQVLFTIDGTSSAPVALGDGSASFNPQFTPGSHTVVATYLGSANFNGSSSDPINVLGPASSVSLAVSSSANPSAAGAQVTISVHAIAASGVATGNVSFSADGNPLGYSTLDGTGVATLSFVPGLGTHQIEVTYAGNQQFSAASGSLAQVVNPAATVTTLTSSNLGVVSGQNVTFEAQVSTVIPELPAASGTVLFLDGAIALGVGSLGPNGLAVLNTSALTAGKHAVSATYLGTPNFATSGSVPLKQFVGQAATTLSLQSSAGESASGQKITLSAVVAVIEPGSGTPTGTVEFFDGDTDLGPGALDKTGTASLQIASPSVGAHQLSASYGGDANFSAPDDAQLSQLVDLAQSSTAIVSSSNPSVFGQPLTLSANVAAVAPGAGFPTGSVIFSEGDQVLGEVTLDQNGAASIATNGFPAGSHLISVAYQGDDNFDLSSSSTLNQIVNQGGVSVALSSSGSSVFGSPVSFSVQVSAAAPASGIPGGAVVLRDGDQTLQLLTLSAGQASFTTSALTAGSHAITASYQGDDTFTGGAQGALTQIVSIAPTNASLSAAPSPAVFGQSITLTASVSPAALVPPPFKYGPVSAGLTGQVTFKNDLVTLGTAPVDETGTATLSVSSLAVGTQNLTATYSGDGNFASSTATASDVIGKAAPDVSVISSAAPAVFGQTIVYTARVQSEVGSPSGTVTFFDGEQQLGAAVVGASGRAIFATASLGVGTHSINAYYSGDGSFLTGSATYSQLVGTGSVAVSLSSSQSPLSYGLAVTFTAQVSAGIAGATLPTGNVVFTDGTTTLGTASLTQGFASLQAGGLSAGTHTINASYLGDDNFAGGSASAFSQVISRAATATQLSASAQTTVMGEPILLTASVLSAGGAPSGPVIFSEGATVLGTSSVDSNGKATLPIASLSVGTHFVTASYGGDANFTGSAAAAASVLVGQAATSMTIVSSSSPIGIEQPLTLTAVIKVASPGAGAPSGTVTFSEGVITVGIGALDGHGRAVIITNALLAGDHAIFATYNGDASFSSSASATIGQTVVKSGATLAVASSAATAAYSSPILLTAKVSASADLEVPTGTIAFSEGGVSLGSATLDKNAAGSLQLGVLTAGSHTIVAAYSGDSVHLASAQAQVVQVVTQAATSTALTGSTGSGTLIYTAVVSTQATSGSPTGTISFLDGSTVLFAGTVGADRTVTFQASASGASGRSIVAVYGGDANFAGSASAGVTQNLAVASGCSSSGDTTGGLLFLIALLAVIARSSKSKVERAV